MIEIAPFVSSLYRLMVTPCASSPSSRAISDLPLMRLRMAVLPGPRPNWALRPVTATIALTGHRAHLSPLCGYIAQMEDRPDLLAGPSPAGDGVPERADAARNRT